MKKVSFILLLCLAVSTTLKAQDVPIEKFLGIWHNNYNDYWSSNNMKISQENGKIILQVKNLVSGEATLNGNRLEITVVDEVNYGKFWVGAWGGWYDSDGDWEPRSENNILVGHSDGSHGSNGQVGGFYSEQYRHSKANKEISYLTVRVVYKYEGTLELYFCYHSTYYNGNTPLFYQGKVEDMYNFKFLPIIYTNW